MKKICIITGASSGLGKMFVKAAKELVPADEFWLISRSEEKLKETAEEFGVENARIIPLDLTDSTSYSQLDGLLSAGEYEICALINNAGAGKLGNVSELSYTDQADTVKLNCEAVTAVAAICLKYMKLSYMKKGSFILNTGSIAAFAPNARLTAYAASKSYVVSFTEGLAFELKGSGINACVCCPGPMDTAFLSNANITKGASHTFDTLPYCDPEKVAYGAIKAAMKGKLVYTPKLFYKFYRLVAKILPVRLVMHMAKA